MNLSRRHKTLFVCLFAILFFASLLFWFLLIPPSHTSLTKVIMIKKGTPLRKISGLLEQEGIIRNREFFIGMVTLLGKKGEIKAGEYEFHTRMLPFEVLSTLAKGQVKRHLVTIPEGYTLSQIGQLLEDLSIAEKITFLQKTASPAFIASLGLLEHFSNQTEDSPQKKGGMTLEGYLFPDTYHFIKEMEPEEMIRMMTHQFRKIFGPDLIEKASQLGISPREAVILASIIEKEASLSEEKPLVSAVFHNRLKRRLPLQSDPTVIYGISNFDGNLTKEHLLTPSPFNTYLNWGLPPTPICNPGKESMMAALNPASVPHLYFVSKNDGSHHFSESYEEHQRAVWKYQKTPLRKN
ncbi:MAG: endolytic transglycosylase MltG [Deltaproteobacteria bacterium]|nr:endolytic transglycosylase MltG [Deltaproteobacteria bacterium]